jgi:hypothetical protein
MLSRMLPVWIVADAIRPSAWISTTFVERSSRKSHNYTSISLKCFSLKFKSVIWCAVIAIVFALNQGGQGRPLKGNHA